MLTNFEANERVLYTLRCHSVSIGKFSGKVYIKVVDRKCKYESLCSKARYVYFGERDVYFTCSSLLRLRATSVTSSTRILALLHRPGLVDEFLMNTLLLNKTVGE